MFLGLGTDIIEIQRIEQAVKRFQTRFINKIFTEHEAAYCLSLSNPYPSFAARFAAKEAVAKALGCGISKDLYWTDIEIVKNPQKPIAKLSSKSFLKFPNVKLIISLSHCKFYATATAIALREN